MKPNKQQQNDVATNQDKEEVSRGLGLSGYLGIELALESVINGVDVGSYIDGVATAGRGVADGNMRPVKSMLFAQAKMLDTLFYVTLQRAGKAKSTELNLKFLNTAIKIQSASRATLEALNETVNPKRTVFANQANIAQQQIVNNEPARVEKIESTVLENELEQPRLDHATLDT